MEERKEGRRKNEIGREKERERKAGSECRKIEKEARNGRVARAESATIVLHAE